MCPGLAEQRTGRGNLRRGGACTTRRPVRCEECGRCDMHCETMLEKGRHCHSDSEEEDGDEQEDEEEHADAGDGGAEADDEEEEDTEEMLIKDLVEFFSLSKSFAHYTYKLTAASTPSATAHSNAYRLLTRITAQVGEILKARGAADDVVEQWHAAEAGPALGDVQERAAELLDSLPVRCPGHQAVAMLMCAASPSKKGRALPNAEIDFVSTRDVIAGRKLFAEIMESSGSEPMLTGGRTAWSPQPAAAAFLPGARLLGRRCLLEPRMEMTTSSSDDRDDVCREPSTRSTPRSAV